MLVEKKIPKESAVQSHSLVLPFRITYSNLAFFVWLSSGSSLSKSRPFLPESTHTPNEAFSLYLLSHCCLKILRSHSVTMLVAMKHIWKKLRCSLEYSIYLSQPKARDAREFLSALYNTNARRSDRFESVQKCQFIRVNFMLKSTKDWNTFETRLH